MQHYVYILTKEYNEYDQYGEYFEDVFKDKPSPEQLSKSTNYASDSESIRKLLAVGTCRLRGDHSWYNLRKEELK